MAHDTFRVGDLTAVIGDNAAAGDHRAGYNGVWSLVHRTQPMNLFVPTVAGLNLEHIFDGDRIDKDNTRRIFFEPRNAPMMFRRISDTESELHQPPTPTFHLESWTRFTLAAPHYVDMSFRFRPTQHAFNHGYIGLFWASYIHGPEDKSIYFRSNGQWQQLCTQRHNDESTVRQVADKFDLRFSEGYPECLYRNYSPMRFDEPFYYGLFHNHVAIFMFDRMEGIRFTHSPSGGGLTKERQTSNPAWDFQYILPKYEVKKEYGFRARLAYRPRCTRAEILEEVAAWRKSLKS
ncbi:MAG: hypothetical protein L0Y72_10110 [Gemmataceae bacterium]|nr:hypothetical protein [Gemmataceae bacterium]MCI0739387.1 hypothetical protein [Gemmataceae bacterium]